MNEAQTLMAFASLSNATRLRMLRELVAAGPDGLLAGELADAVEASPSRASFHLANMSKAGLISSSQSAREITYCADYDVIGAMINFFMTDCCAGNSAILACCVDRKARGN